jgi:hypothetical protein
MPYFLVTHTPLIEADNETTAAEIVQAKIARGDQVVFDVEAYEQHIVKIIVEAGARKDAHPRLPPERQGMDLQLPLSIRCGCQGGGYALAGLRKPATSSVVQCGSRCRRGILPDGALSPVNAGGQRLPRMFPRQARRSRLRDFSLGYPCAQFCI